MKRSMPIPAILMFLGLLSAFLAGCQSSPEPGRYYNKMFAFSIVFPEDWEHRENAGTPVIAFCPLKDVSNGFRANVNVTVENTPPNMTLDEYTDTALENLKTITTHFDMHERKSIALNGRPAIQLVSSYGMGKVECDAIAYIVMAPKQIYIITCTAGAGQLPVFRSRFEKIAKTFRVED